MKIRKHMEILGHKVKDKITGLTGVAASISFDLYGCIQVVVNPGTDKEGKLKDSHWFDIARLEVIDKKRVLDPPSYDFGPVAEGKQGAAEKPSFYKV